MNTLILLLAGGVAGWWLRYTANRELVKDTIKEIRQYFPKKGGKEKNNNVTLCLYNYMDIYVYNIFIVIYAIRADLPLSFSDFIHSKGLI
ncbi:MAG: hypothetical protein HQK77_14565 [Desulfobacterales bacterium]|nr:hypothetical protein [Desulfobacterales bacterium]